MVSSAARIGSINILLQTQLGPGMAGLQAFANQVDRTGAGVTRSVAGIDRSLGGLNRSMSNINTRGMTSLTLGALRAGTALDSLRGFALAAGVAVGGLMPAAIAAGMIRTADGAHRLSNQLRTVTTDAADLKNTQQELFDVAQRSRSSFEATTTIYARTARAVEHLNMKQKDLLRMTETVQKAFSVGGATTAEAWGGAVQLSQGIASNRFSGDEFRSVAENAPVLLQGMAKHLGVTIGKLREMAHAGQLTADVVTRAIIGASEEIDEAFAKTTSTIEQAWTRVGNAVTKYAMDSEKASAGSRAIVGSLNLMAENVSGLVDIIVALGAALVATYAGRGLNAIKQNISATTASLDARRAETAEIVKQAQAEAVLARNRMVSARLAVQRAYGDRNFTPKQVERLEKEAARATLLHRDAKDRLTVATNKAGDALDAVAVKGRAFAAAGNLGRAAWSFIGGPFGAALLGVGAYMYMTSRQAAIAEEQSSKYADAIKKAGDDSDYASGGIRRAAEALAGVSKDGDAARLASYASALSDVQTNLGQMGSKLLEAQGITNFFSRSYSELTKLYNAFREGTISAEEFRAKSDEIARQDPGLAPYIAQMQAFGDQTDAARGYVDGLTTSLEDARKALGALFQGFIDGKKGRLGTGDLTAIYGGDTQDTINLARRMNPDLFKGLGNDKPKKTGGGSRAPRKTADDRFDNMLQSLTDRTEALRQEREALNLNYAEQLRREESLKLEQEALKRVREEARRKGETDWQNAQLTPEQIALIRERVNAHVEEAMALKYAKESQDAWKDAAASAGDMMRGLIDGTMDWKTALLQLIPVVLKLMNSLNVAHGGKGLFGGGIFQSLIGGLLGFSFHSGGTVGKTGNVVQFPTGAPFAGVFHGGGNFGGRRAKHDEVMALVQTHENIFTDGQTDKIIGALSSSAGKMEEQTAYAPVYNIDARGADAAAVARLEAGLKERDRQFGTMVDRRTNVRQIRKTRG